MMNVTTTKTWRSLPEGSMIQDIVDVDGHLWLGTWIQPLTGIHWIASVPKEVCGIPQGQPSRKVLKAK